MSEPADPTRRLAAVTLDEASIGRGNPDQEHERAIAIYDILESNRFCIPDHPVGPYTLKLAIVESKLALEVSAVDQDGSIVHYLSLTPLRRVMRDYKLICESYFGSIRGGASPTQIEAIDMGRRGLHNEASELLMERLAGKVEIDFDTARRLFTLIYALHWKG